MTSESNPLSRILDKNILTGLNFNDCLRNLEMVLDMEKITYVLDQFVPMKLP